MDPIAATSKPVYDDFAVAATELGHGNYSVVYKATHKVTKQTYALKVLDKAKVRRMAARHPSINLEVMQVRLFPAPRPKFNTSHGRLSEHMHRNE